MSSTTNKFDLLLKKFKNGIALTANQRELVNSRLTTATQGDDVYAALRLFAAHNLPTSNNVSLLSRWLDKDTTSDRNMLGAIMGADQSWGIEKLDVSTIAEIAKPDSMVSHPSSLIGALSALSDSAQENLDAARALLHVYEYSKNFEFVGELDQNQYLSDLGSGFRLALEGEASLRDKKIVSLASLSNQAELLRLRITVQEQ